MAIFSLSALGAMPPITIRSAPPRAQGVVFDHAGPIGGILQPGLHAPHQHAVFLWGMAKLQRRAHVGIGWDRVLRLLQDPGRARLDRSNAT